MPKPRDQWKAAKDELEKAHIDTKKLFRQDLGPALDRYEAARSKYEDVRIDSKSADEQDEKAKKAAIAESTKAQQIFGGYCKILKDLKGAPNATNAVKQAVSKTEGKVIHLGSELLDARNGKFR